MERGTMIEIGREGEAEKLRLVEEQDLADEAGRLRASVDEALRAANDLAARVDEAVSSISGDVSDLASRVAALEEARLAHESETASALASLASRIEVLETALPTPPRSPYPEGGDPLKKAATGSINAMIAAASAGDVIRIPGGVYREGVVLNKAVTLVSEDPENHAEVRGSDVWNAANGVGLSGSGLGNAWSSGSGAWTSSNVVPPLLVETRWQGEPGSEAWRWPEQVFVDGKELRRVAPGVVPGPGQFGLTSTRRVVLGEDPAGRLVEVTSRNYGVRIASSGATVDGLAVYHAGSRCVSGANVDEVTVRNCDLAYAHTKVIAIGASLRTKILDSRIHHGGQQGIGANAAEYLEIRGNLVHDHNTRGFDTAWEAGGMKLSNLVEADVSGNEVRDVFGMGIWTDMVNPAQRRVYFVENSIHHCSYQGVRVEITKNFEVKGNRIWECGKSKGDSMGGCAIAIAGSHDGEVNGNVLAWNNSGIAFVQQNRTGDDDYDRFYNVRWNDNVVVTEEIPGSTQRDAFGMWGLATTPMAYPKPWEVSEGNTGSGNRYWFSGTEGEINRWKGGSQAKTLSVWLSQGLDAGARYTTDAEKDAALEAAGIPLSPEA